jgi:DNA-binding NtrC family response regulator
VDKNARILIIDDDKVIRQTLTITLEDEGYIVDTAKNGKEAIEKTNANFYNLAIVDWRLPDIQGTKLLQELKKTTPKMAKVMLTGYPSMNNAIDAVNERADAFLVKPIAINELLVKIRELLELQKEDALYSQAKVAEFIETRTKQVLETELNEKLTSGH